MGQDYIREYLTTHSIYSINVSRICKDPALKNGVATIRRVLKNSEDMPSPLRSKIFDLYSLGKLMMDFMIPITSEIRDDVTGRIDTIDEEWNKQKEY